MKYHVYLQFQTKPNWPGHDLLHTVGLTKFRFGIITVTFVFTFVNVLFNKAIEIIEGGGMKVFALISLAYSVLMKWRWRGLFVFELLFIFGSKENHVDHFK